MTIRNWSLLDTFSTCHFVFFFSDDLTRYNLWCDRQGTRECQGGQNWRSRGRLTGKRLEFGKKMRWTMLQRMLHRLCRSLVALSTKALHSTEVDTVLTYLKFAWPKSEVTQQSVCSKQFAKKIRDLPEEIFQMTLQILFWVSDFRLLLWLRRFTDDSTPQRGRPRRKQVEKPFNTP